jgi:hypothetical protein
MIEELGGPKATRAFFDELAANRRDQRLRTKMCVKYADAFDAIGNVIWVQGALVGPDRVAGHSPHGFGSDDVVGLATVCQITAELAKGAISLFRAGNDYGRMALVRQLVELEYLAAAFAEKDQIAADWMRADRQTRISFWSAQKLRERSNGKFLREDYWDHCEKGGHPTPEALMLLPNHEPVPTAFHWSDMAGHLRGTWFSLKKAIQARPNSIVLPPKLEGQVSSVDQAEKHWLETDQLTIALRFLHGRFGGASNRVTETPRMSPAPVEGRRGQDVLFVQSGSAPLTG